MFQKPNNKIRHLRYRCMWIMQRSMNNHYELDLENGIVDYDVYNACVNVYRVDVFRPPLTVQ